MNATAPLSPKEYAALEFGDHRSAKWVRAQCALFIRSKGRSGIPVVAVNGKPAKPYLIPRSELGRFQRPLFCLRAVKVA